MADPGAAILVIVEQTQICDLRLLENCLKKYNLPTLCCEKNLWPPTPLSIYEKHVKLKSHVSKPGKITTMDDHLPPLSSQPLIQ